MTSHKAQIHKTGGGPPPDEPKLDPIEEILIKIINEKTVCGFVDKPFDSDGDGVQENIQVYEFSSSAVLAEPNVNYICDEVFPSSASQEIFDIPDFSQKKYQKKENRYTPYGIEQQTVPGTYKKSSTTCTSRTDSSGPMGGDIIDIPDFFQNKANRHPPFDLDQPISEELKVHTPLSQATVRDIKGVHRNNSASVTQGTPMSMEVVDTSAKENIGSRQTPKKTAYPPRTDRRRPMGGVRVLTSSDVAEKYNLLLDKRLILVEKQIQQGCNEEKTFKEEHEYKVNILKQQSEKLSLEKEEKLLKIELLKADLKYKKAFISSNI